MSSNSEQQNSGTTFAASYMTKDTIPHSTPAKTIYLAATIYFDGLLCMCFDNTSECVVAVNEQPLPHMLEFGVWNSKTTPCETLSIPFPKDFAEIEIRVEKAVPVLDGVYAYHGPPAGTTAEPRASFVDHCIDLEKVHGGPLKAKAMTLLKRFHIKNGLFFAYKVSSSTFELRKPGVLPKGPPKVALAVAADIFLDSDADITFKVTKGPKFSYQLPWKAGAGDRYEIGITNACHGCTFSPLDPDPEHKTLRNDFWQHYEALTVDVADQFQLFNTAPGGSADPTTLGACVRPAGGASPFSDPAPCMPVYLGQSRQITY